MRIFISFCLVLLSLWNKTAAQDPVAQENWRLDADNETADMRPLHAYDSYFGQATDFGLSIARYRPRGYAWRYRSLRRGGVEFRDWFRGAPAWNAVSGLSAVGVPLYDPRMTTPGALGRTEERQIMPWEQPRGGKASFSAANRTYNYRGTLSYNSGENTKNGWAYSLYAGRTWGRSYVVEGVWNDSWAAFGSVSRRFGDHHRIALTAWYAPSRRALASAATDEAFSLTGNNLYNPAWGRWDGTPRSTNLREAHQPIALLTHEYTADDHFTLTTTLAARLGTESYSGLNWQNAPNPRPDYYRHMPSFQPAGSAMRERVTELWRTDENVRQIDWSTLVSRNTGDGPRAHYITESRVRDYREFTLQSTAAWRPDGETLLRGGIELFGAENLNYKRLEELLGGGYWLDVDVFAENDEDVRNNTQNDMHHPDRHVLPGEEFGYKYSMQAFFPRVWSRFDKRLKAWDFEAAGSLGMAAYHRFGYYDKQNFPGDASFGWSPWVTRVEWSVQGGVGYNIGSRLRAGFRFTGQSLAPTPQSAFISPEYRNAQVPNLKNEEILSGELRLDYRTPFVRASLCGFATSIRNRTEVLAFYDDLNHFFCNYLLAGIDERHLGIELSAEVQLGTQVWLRAAGVVSDNRYANDPVAQELRENTGETVLEESVHYTGLRVAAGPQTAGVVELEYTPRSWVFSLALNGFAGSYISPTPLRRTERAALLPGYENAAEQERFGAGATMDLFLGKTIYLPHDQRLGIYAGINNLLNRRNLRTGGYESSRLRNRGTAAEPHYVPLDSKYYFAQGINFFVTASWRF